MDSYKFVLITIKCDNCGKTDQVGDKTMHCYYCTSTRIYRVK